MCLEMLQSLTVGEIVRYFTFLGFPYITCFKLGV